MAAIPPLRWAQFTPFAATPFAQLSLCGRYVILRSTLPELRAEPTVVYTVRKRDRASATADPTTLGYHLAERYTLREAEQVAQQDAWSEAQGAERHVPRDYPAVAVEHFYWPISDGCMRAALVIVRRAGKTYAQVVGMGRRGDDRYHPSEYAEIEVTAEMVEYRPVVRPPIEG